MSLSSNIAELDTVSNIKVVKNFIEKKPHTMLRVAPKNRHAFDKHCREIDRRFMGLSRATHYP